MRLFASLSPTEMGLVESQGRALRLTRALKPQSRSGKEVHSIRTHVLQGVRGGFEASGKTPERITTGTGNYACGEERM